MGAGEALIRACVAHARAVDGGLQVPLTVGSHKQSAVRLYERLGFARYGREPRALLLPDGTHGDEDLIVLFLDA
jgi:ribosomal protein S18 acetylase RimI-like enzyme